MAKAALGRGLGALLGSSPAPAAEEKPQESAVPPRYEISEEAQEASLQERVLRVPLDDVHPCSFQPRKSFDNATIEELAASIREQGVLQPLVVRRSGETLELIAGERRWRAARVAGLQEVPVILREADDATVLEWALIENLQRENLNPIEEARGYAQLIDQFQLRQEDVGRKVGKSRTAVTNALRLLKLDPQVQDLIRDGRLSSGHAKALLGLTGHEKQRHAAARAIHESWSVRKTEQWVAAQMARAAAPTDPAAVPASTQPSLSAYVHDLENRLRERLGTKVSLQYAEGKGSIQIRIFNDEDLQRILQTLGIQLD